MRVFIFSDKDSSISKHCPKVNTEKLKMGQNLKVKVLLNFLINSAEELLLQQAKEKLLHLQRMLKVAKELLSQMMLKLKDLKKNEENLRIKNQKNLKPLLMLWKKDSTLI